MKRLLILAFVAMGLAAMTSCKKENSERILGTWVSTAVTYQQTTVIHGDSENTETKTFTAGWFTVTFIDNGTMTISFKDDNGGTETWTENYFVPSNDLLVWEGRTFTIQQLDRKKLLLERSEADTMLTFTDEACIAQYVTHFDFDRKL